MSTKTLRVCDALDPVRNSDGTYTGVPCNLPFAYACHICGGDRCAKHEGEDITTRVSIGNRGVFGVWCAGKICAACLSPTDINYARTEIGPLLSALDGPIVSVIRASISARALKDEQK